MSRLPSQEAVLSGTVPRAKDVIDDESPEKLRFVITGAQNQDFAILLGVLDLAENDERDMVVCVCPCGVHLRLS